MRPPWTQPTYARIWAQVEAHAGLAPPSCVPAAEEGIERARLRSGLPTLDAYAEGLQAAPALMADLLVELTVGETYFFRTPEHFDFLRDTVLPELRARRGEDHGVSAWSAGCASGEEAYTLAVVLLEAGWGGRMRVLGTDVSRLALARARRACYRDWSLRGEAAERMQPWFRRHTRTFRLLPQLRRAVRFSTLNLALDTYPDPSVGLAQLDIILCRNVLIYFRLEGVAAVARRLFECLAPGGYLLTGPSDPSLAAHAPFELVPTRWGLALRRPLQPAARPVPPTALPPAAPAPAAALPVLPPPPPPPPASVSPPAPPPAPAATRPRLAEAEAALQAGRWREAVALAAHVAETDVAAARLRVRALANLDPLEAEAECVRALGHHPLDVALHHLHGLLLLGLGRPLDAERAVRRVVYLEPQLAVGYLTLGHVLARLGEAEPAARAFLRAAQLLERLPADAPVPLAEGEHAAHLAAAARREAERVMGGAGPRLPGP